MIYNEDRFQRIRLFGDNKNKLAMLLFGQKVQNSMMNLSRDETQEINVKKFSLELNDEEEACLENIYKEIQMVKKKYDFANLESYIASVMKNYSAVEKSDTLNIEKIKGFLEKFCLSNFFKQSPNITNINFLNYKDDQFIKRFEFIMIV